MSDNPFEYNIQTPSFLTDIEFKSTPGLKIYGKPSYKVHIRSFKPPSQQSLKDQFGSNECNNPESKQK